MRPTASLILTSFAALMLAACSNAANASNASNVSADTTAPASTAAAASVTDSAAPPVYPGATPGKKPELVASSSSPTAKAYTTPDDLAKVIAWYKSALPNASEMSDPGDKTTDVFMIPGGKSGTVVVIQNFGGKTWIVIGPGFPQ